MIRPKGLEFETSAVTPTYGKFLGAGFLDSWLEKTDPTRDGFTCCWDPDLAAGTLPSESFDRWLAQDHLFARGLTAGDPPEMWNIDMPETMRDKYQYYTCADTSKLTGSGYDGGVTPLDAAVRDYVVEYLVPAKLLDSAG